jgi:hypothetical protein
MEIPESARFSVGPHQRAMSPRVVSNYLAGGAALSEAFRAQAFRHFQDIAPFVLPMVARPFCRRRPAG